MEPVSWLLCLTAIFVSGILRGFSGFGFALAATPLLSGLLPPSEAVPIVLILQIGASLIGFRGTVSTLDRRSVIILSGAATVATPVGVALLVIFSAQTSRIVIALLTLLSVVAVQAGLRFKRQPTISMTLPFGLVAGIFSGLCAMAGPPVILFYTASTLSNACARASMTAIFLITGLSSLVAAQHAGLITGDAVRIALFGSPAMIAGTWLGGRLFARYHSRFYKKASMAALVGIAAISGARAFL